MAKEKVKKRIKELNVVIIDDDFASRQVLSLVLKHYAKKFNLKLNIYSSANGLEGVGYLMVTLPDVLIFDTTLPKYSGTEMANFVVTNPRFDDAKLKILMLEGSDRFSEGILKYNKSESAFINDFLKTIFYESVLEEDTLKDRFVRYTSSKAIKWTDYSDRQIKDSTVEKSSSKKAWMGFNWFLSQIVTNIFLLPLYMMLGQWNEENEVQSSKDLMNYRFRLYPVLTAMLVSSLLLILQITAIVGGSATLLSRGFTGIFANEEQTITLDVNSNMSFNSEEVEVTDGQISLIENSPEDAENAEVQGLYTDIFLSEAPVSGSESSSIEDSGNEESNLDSENTTGGQSDDEESSTTDAEVAGDGSDSSTTEENSVSDEELVDETDTESGNAEEQTEEIDPNEAQDEDSENNNEESPVEPQEGEEVLEPTEGPMDKLQFSKEAAEVVFIDDISTSEILSIEEVSNLNDANSSIGEVTFGATTFLPSTGILYQLSPNGEDWYFWDGTGWGITEAGKYGANSVQELNQSINQFPFLDKFMVKAFLISDGYTDVKLDEINITYLPIVEEAEEDVVVVEKEIQDETQQPEINESDEVGDVDPTIDTETEIVDSELDQEEEQKEIPKVIKPLSDVRGDIKPVIYSASTVDGVKKISGIIELPQGVSIPLEDFSKTEVRVYYAESKSFGRTPTDANWYLGSAELIENYKGDLSFSLEVEGDPGGFITAQLVQYNSDLKTQVDFVSSFARTVENSTFTVIDSGDGSDATPGDGICEVTAGIGDCTLRAAIQESNANGVADDIYITSLGADINIATALPAIQDDIAIYGANFVPNSTCNINNVETTIIADPAVANVFEVTPSAPGMMLNAFTGLSIMGGDTGLYLNGDFTDIENLTCNRFGVTSSPTAPNPVDGQTNEAILLNLTAPLDNQSAYSNEIAEGGIGADDDGNSATKGEMQVVDTQYGVRFSNSSYGVNIENTIFGLDLDDDTDLGAQLYRGISGSFLQEVNTDGFLIKNNVITNYSEGGIYLRQSRGIILDNTIGLNRSQNAIYTATGSYGINSFDSPLVIGSQSATINDTTCSGGCNSIAVDGAESEAIVGSREPIKVFNNKIQQAKLDGTMIGSNVKAIEFLAVNSMAYQTEIVGNHIGCANGTNTQNCVSFFGMEDLLVQDNYIGLDSTGLLEMNNNNAYPSSVALMLLDPGSNITIDNNLIAGQIGFSNYDTYAGYHGRSATDITFDNNTVGLDSSGGLLTNSTNFAGFYVLTTTHAESFNGNLRFDSNTFANSLYDGFYVADAAEKMLFTNNTFRDNGRNGITIHENDLTSTVTTTRVGLLENNSFSNNGALGIDLHMDDSTTAASGGATDGVTPIGSTFGVDSNHRINYPDMVSYKPAERGGQNYIDLFGTYTGEPDTFYELTVYDVSSPDPTDHGEGGSVVGRDLIKLDPSGFLDFTTVPLEAPTASLYSGSLISVVATRCENINIGSTVCLEGGDVYSSEFSANVTEYFGFINGQIYYDEEGNGAVSSGDEMTGTQMTMRLYSDNGNGVPDSGDAYVDSTLTETDGSYQFVPPANGTYWVTAESSDFNAAGATSAIAEQSYSGSGGLCLVNDELDTLSSDGECFGGLDPRIGDNAAGGLESAKHVARVEVNEADVNNVDFGFTYNLISNTNDTGQGTLRQFILNSNELAGTQIARFELWNEDVRYYSDADYWEFIPQSALPVITDEIRLTPTNSIYANTTSTCGYDSETETIDVIPKYRINGANVATDGIVFGDNSTGSTLYGFNIAGFGGSGVVINDTLTDGVPFQIIGCNYIGTDITGTSPDPNGENGIAIYDSQVTNYIYLSANLISSNTLDGVYLESPESDELRLQYNYIGTDITGLNPLGNGESGVHFSVSNNDSSSGHLLGGAIPQSRNIISGNGQYGVQINGNVENSVIGNNYIGVGVDGSTPVPNSSNGISIGSFNGGSYPGGNISIYENTVAMNLGSGVSAYEFGDISIYDNYIGTNAELEDGLGNANHGIAVVSNAHSSENITATDNYIINNGLRGVSIYENQDWPSIKTTVALSRNLIYGNDATQIDILGKYGQYLGATSNDEDDIDIGANDVQNYPVFSNIEYDGINQELNVSYTLDTEIGKYLRVEFFSGDDDTTPSAMTYLGESVIKTVDGVTYEETIPVAVPLDERYLVATATICNLEFCASTDYGTSEFTPPNQILFIGELGLLELDVSDLYAEDQEQLITVTDADMNLDSAELDDVSVLLTNQRTGEQEFFELIETGIDTGTFTVQPEITISLSEGINYDGEIFGTQWDDIRVEYVDDITPTGSTEVIIETFELREYTPPVVVDDEVDLVDEESVEIDVLANDYDLDNDIDIDTLEILTEPVDNDTAQVELTEDDTIIYTTDLTYQGQDSFEYLVCDLRDQCTYGEVIVNIDVTPPSVNDDDIEVDEDSLVRFNILDNDTDYDGISDNFDPESIEITQIPMDGVLNTDNLAFGELIYTPNTNYYGPDLVNYRACDINTGLCGSAVVNINVISVNDAPSVNDDNYTVQGYEGLYVNMAPLLNDSDPDDGLDYNSIQIIDEFEYGELELLNEDDRIYRYTLSDDLMRSGNVYQVDTVTYAVCDNSGNCQEAEIIISIETIPEFVDESDQTDDNDDEENGDEEDEPNNSDNDLIGADDPPTEPDRSGNNEDDGSVTSGESLESTPLAFLNPVADYISRNAEESSAIAAAVGFIVAVSQFNAAGYSLLSGFTYLYHGLTNFLSVFGLARKKERYGFVYNAVTKEPVKRMIIRIYDTEDQLVDTAVTDAFGVFELGLEPGKYKFKPMGNKFTFPSSVVKGKIDDPYQNIYRGEYLNVNDKKIIDISIPVDPVDEMVSNKQKFTQTLRNNWFFINLGLYITAFIFALILIFLNPSILNFIILLIYIITGVFIAKNFISSPIRHSTVTDIEGNPLEGVAVGLRRKDNGTMVAKRITDEAGNYRFIVPPGDYRITLEDNDYLLKTDHMELEGSVKSIFKVGYMGKDLKVKKDTSEY